MGSQACAGERAVSAQIPTPADRMCWLARGRNAGEQALLVSGSGRSSRSMIVQLDFNLVQDGIADDRIPTVLQGLGDALRVTKFLVLAQL